ncbi:hypothetical protein HYT24_00580 [Candidatus Pacearchaeota archaeon]|nr:hypothetical protein [Candidatus Pacearchaeota archaeon]
MLNGGWYDKIEMVYRRETQDSPFLYRGTWKVEEHPSLLSHTTIIKDITERDDNGDPILQLPKLVLE